MAELNFGLLTPPGSQSIGNAFVQGMEQAAVARAQENQNALAQYTLGKAKREDELTNKMLAGMQSATTLEQQAAVLRSVGRYKDASDLMNSDLERRYRLGQIEAQPGALLKNKADTAILHGNIMEREANAVVANPTSARAMQAVVNFGKATGQDVTQELKTLTELGDDPNKIVAWARGHALKGKDLAAFSTPKPTPTNVGNRIVFLDMNPNSPTFKSEVMPQQNIGVSPNTIAQINATRTNHLENLAQQGWIFDTDRGLAVNPRLGISQSISTLMASVEPQGSAGNVAPAAPAAIPTAPSAAPASALPPQLNVTPGIAPSSASNVPIPQSIVGARVPPALQNVRDNDRLAILLKERENQVFLGRVDPALDREIANLQGKPTNVASQTTTQPAQRTVLGPKTETPRFDTNAGGFVYPPSAENPQGKFVPVSGLDGKPLNESQGNATAYGLRMKEAEAILADLANPKIGNATLRGANVESIPFVGGAVSKVLPSFLGGSSEQQQQVNQAKTNFITAVLRKESGAAIGKDEFATEDRKYFPQLNDGPKVIKQKEDARRLAIEAMKFQAGPGAKEIDKYVPSISREKTAPNLSEPPAGAVRVKAK